MSPAATANPLLETWTTPFGVPPFDLIRPEHFLPAIGEAMRRHDMEIAAIAANPDRPTFANTVAALDDSGALLARLANVLVALSRAETGPELQQVEASVAPMLAGHADDMLLDGALFARVEAVFADRTSLQLDPEQATLLQRLHRRFVRGGARLATAQKERLRAINAELSGLAVRFARNLLRETNSYMMVVEDPCDLAGLPEDQVEAAATVARGAGLTGKWAFTLKFPSIWPFLKSSANRELRRRILTAYTMRCSRDGETDNRPVFARIAALRVEKARLLGYPTWADFVLEETMAGTPENVYGFLARLWKPVLAKAREEAADLQALIDAEGGGFELEPWDWRYYSEKLKRARHDFDEEAIRPYLPLDAVRRGAFLLAGRLYGLSFTERADIPVYQPEVKAYEGKEHDGSHLGILYLDFHPRPGKQSGAWLSVIRGQCIEDGRFVTPVVANAHNIARPAGEAPALLTPEEAKAMVFHEFGHALHALFSRCRFRGSGISSGSIAPDFIELPSQVMENWVFEPVFLKLLARHHESGEAIPDALVEAMHTAATFGQGFAMAEYLAAALLDMDWHTLTEPEVPEIEAFEHASLARWGLIPEILPRYRTAYFLHAAHERYSAGYYGYAWSMALDADAFAAFTETGDVFDRRTADAFRELLAQGGGEDPAVLFRRFRGRDVDIAPLLLRLGVDPAGGERRTGGHP